jgi:hypothetical protein
MDLADITSKDGRPPFLHRRVAMIVKVVQPRWTRCCNFVEPQGPLKGKPVHLNVIPPEAVDVRQPRLEMDLPVCPCDQKRRRTAF